MISEFLIGLFGSMYYGGKYASEKIQRSAYDYRMKRRQVEKRIWIDSVTDEELELEVKRYINDNEDDLKKELMQEFTLFQKIFDDNDTLIPNRYENDIAMGGFYIGASRILLAEYGKLNRADVSGVESLRFHNRTKEKLALQLEFMKLWDETLQKNGFDPMLWAPTDSTGTIPNVREAILVKNRSFTMELGKFFWHGDVLSYFG